MEVIAVFIPIIFMIVTGLVLILLIYFNSKEKQMMIERGLNPYEFTKTREVKKTSTWMLKLGIIVIMFGIGLGLGFMLEDSTGAEVWVPFLMITFLGFGFVAAYFAAKRIEKSAGQNYEEINGAR